MRLIIDLSSPHGATTQSMNSFIPDEAIFIQVKSSMLWLLVVLFFVLSVVLVANKCCPQCHCIGFTLFYIQSLNAWQFLSFFFALPEFQVNVFPQSKCVCQTGLVLIDHQEWFIWFYYANSKPIGWLLRHHPHLYQTVSPLSSLPSLTHSPFTRFNSRTQFIPQISLPYPRFTDHSSLPPNRETPPYPFTF